MIGAMRWSVLGLSALLLMWGYSCKNDETQSSSSPASTAASNASSAASGGSGGSTGQGGTGNGGNGSGGDPVTNNGFPPEWINGTDCGNEPDFQQWEYADDTFILRQSLCTDFEGPFIYVLLGTQAVFVQDTGTGDINLYNPISAIVNDWIDRKSVV